MRARILFLIVTLSAVLFGRAAEPLPKVVLLGDSIRLSYAPTVVAKLKGSAVVVSPKANGGDSSNVLKRLADWAIRERPRVVHFNCGIHDTKFFPEQGRFQVPPEKYEANLREIVKRLREQTDAVVLFAMTTPILDERAAAKRKGRDYRLTGAAVKQYNEIALRVMRELKVPVNDLNAAVVAAGAEKLIDADGVHLTKSARESVGEKVAEFIRRRLEQ